MGDEIYALFRQRLQAGWLLNDQSELIIERAEQKLVELTETQPNFIAIATTNPIEFIASFMAGCRLAIPILLCNPHWGVTEWAQVSKLTMQVDAQLHAETIMIPTGGSAGEIKFAIHTWGTLSASAGGFQEFYEVDRIKAICTLPLYHVSGLMQLIRSLLTNGKLLITDFKQLCLDPNLITSEIDLERYFISLVPTQLARLLDLNIHYLARFQTILLGGAPPSFELLAIARSARIPLALTYGMTETASQITSLKPAEFLAGNDSCGRVLPHAKIELTLPDCQIQIAAKSLMLGYFPTVDLATYFQPDDLGSIDSAGYLTILGRNSDKIITGGENVLPIEVVKVIMATGLVQDAWVVGLADRYWGQVVVALYVKNDRPISAAILSRSIAGKISNYKIPKYWVAVERIPRNSLGKILIQEVVEIARIAVPKIT